MGMYPNDPNQMNNMNGGNNPNQSWFEEFPDPNSAPQAMNFQQAPQPYANQAPNYQQTPYQQPAQPQTPNYQAAPAQQVPNYQAAPGYQPAPDYPQIPQIPQAPANAGVPEIQDFASFQQEIDAQGFQPVQPAFIWPWTVPTLQPMLPA